MHAYHVEDGVWYYMVLARNQREAAEAFNCTVGYLRRWGGRYPDDSTAKMVADSEPPGRVWKRKIYQAAAMPWLFADPEWKPKETP